VSARLPLLPQDPGQLFADAVGVGGGLLVKEVGGEGLVPPKELNEAVEKQEKVEASPQKVGVELYGSDWREPPNREATLSDGRRTRKIKYYHNNPRKGCCSN
jgi:hypothetical protein